MRCPGYRHHRYMATGIIVRGTDPQVWCFSAWWRVKTTTYHLKKVQKFHNKLLLNSLGKCLKLTSVFGGVDDMQWSPTNNGIFVEGLWSNSGTSHAGELFGSNANLANRNSAPKNTLIFSSSINVSVKTEIPTSHPIVPYLRRIQLKRVQLPIHWYL